MVLLREGVSVDILRTQDNPPVRSLIRAGTDSRSMTLCGTGHGVTETVQEVSYGILGKKVSY